MKASEDEVAAPTVEPQSPKADEATDSHTSTGQRESTWNSSTPTTWGGDTAAVVNGSPAAPQPAVAVPKVVKTPSTTKLSWAQIAK